MIVELRSQRMVNSDRLLGFEINSLFKDEKSLEKINTAQTIQELEGSDRISDYDLFILRNVVDKMKSDLLSGLKPFHVSVNISAKTLNKGVEVAEIIKDIAKYIILEVTETAIADIEHAKQFVSHVKPLGALVALDDFNHSKHGIELVKELNPDIVKFVYPFDISEVEPFFSIVQQVISHDINITIVFENVENDFELKYIKDNYPKAYIQGYLLDRGETFLSNLRFNN